MEPHSCPPNCQNSQSHTEGQRACTIAWRPRKRLVQRAKDAVSPSQLPHAESLHFAHGWGLASRARDGGPCTKTSHDAGDAGEQPGSPRALRERCPPYAIGLRCGVDFTRFRIVDRYPNRSERYAGSPHVLAPNHVQKGEDALFIQPGAPCQVRQGFSFEQAGDASRMMCVAWLFVRMQYKHRFDTKHCL